MANTQNSTLKTQNVLAILAGGGNLPTALAVAAQAAGYTVHVITFAGQPQPLHMPPVASTMQFPLGQVGHVLAHLKANRATHVALAGHLSKPSILSLKPDAAGLKLLARAVIRHDDALLRAVTGFLEENGFQLITAQDLIPNLLAPKGLHSKAKPTAEEEEDIALARSTLAVLGDLDIGQACIVHHGAILGVEAVEGTDTLIARCADYRAAKTENKSGGILVKRAKDMQTDLADLPTVGPDTFRQLAAHGYRGICIQAGRTILLGKDECISLANQHNLFLLAE